MFKMALFSHAQPRRAKTRPSRARLQANEAPEAYPLGYVEDTTEPRTKLPSVFNILLSRQTRDFHDWPDFHGPLARHGNPRGDGDRLVEVLGVDPRRSK